MQEKSISATNSATLARKKSEIYTIVNKKNSAYQKQTFKDEKNPTTGVFKNSPKFIFLPLESYCYLGENGSEGRVDTMYIRSAPTIFKDDVYYDKDKNFHVCNISEDEAKKKGWTLQKGLISLKRIDTDAKLESAKKSSKAMRIGFEEGLMVLDKYGNDANLKRFIDYHHQNTKSPNYVPPAFTLFVFASLEEEKIAESQIGPIEAVADATNYSKNLRTAVGKKDFKYTDANKAKINATLRLIDQDNFAEENYSQKHLAINNFAINSPIIFMEIIESGFEEKRAVIATGLTEGISVIGYNKEDNSFSLLMAPVKEKPTKRLLVKCESKNYEDSIEELIIHLINTPTDWRDLTLLVEAAKSRNIN